MLTEKLFSNFNHDDAMVDDQLKNVKYVEVDVEQSSVYFFLFQGSEVYTAIDCWVPVRLL